MFNTMYVAILLGLIAAPLLLIKIADSRQKKKELDRQLRQFSSAGSSYGLNFSSQEILHDTIIGLDGQLRKLLVFEIRKEGFSSFLIELDRVRGCSLSGSYGLQSPDQGAETIGLSLKLDNGALVDLCFYDAKVNNKGEEAALKQKARDWERMLSRLKGPNLKTA